MFVHKRPACCVWYLYIITQSRISWLLSFLNLCLSVGSHGLPKHSPQVRKRFASRCSHKQSWLIFLQSLPRFFPMHFLVQDVSFCQVSHVATRQSKLSATMRELVVAEYINLINLRSVRDSCPSRDSVHGAAPRPGKCSANSSSPLLCQRFPQGLSFCPLARSFFW